MIDGPIYPLEDICAAAKADKIAYDGRSQVDALNIGYYDEDVANCLCSLTRDDYVKTVEYTLGNSGKQVKCDVYIAKCISSDGGKDELYIKLRYSGWVVVVSFHQSDRFY